MSNESMKCRLCDRATTLDAPRICGACRDYLDHVKEIKGINPDMVYDELLSLITKNSIALKEEVEAIKTVLQDKSERIQSLHAQLADAMREQHKLMDYLNKEFPYSVNPDAYDSCEVTETAVDIAINILNEMKQKGRKHGNK